MFRDGQFLLAIFCRAENNRFYLNHGIELRPGYLGQWIEINVINLDDEQTDLITYFRSRFLKPTLKAKNDEFE